MKTAEEICKPFGEDVRLEWDEVANLIRAAQADALEAAAQLAIDHNGDDRDGDPFADLAVQIYKLKALL